MNLLVSLVISQSVKCSSQADCSFNGICTTNNTCQCFPQWTGGHCASLRFIPTSKSSGLHLKINNTNTTTWGGGATYDNISKEWHMK